MTLIAPFCAWNGGFFMVIVWLPPLFLVESCFTASSSCWACSRLSCAFRCNSSWSFLCCSRLIWACSSLAFRCSAAFSPSSLYARVFSSSRFLSAERRLSIFSFSLSAFYVVSSRRTARSRRSRKNGGKSGLGAAFHSSFTVTLSCDCSSLSVSVSLGLRPSWPDLLFWDAVPTIGYWCD